MLRQLQCPDLRCGGYRRQGGSGRRGGEHHARVVDLDRVVARFGIDRHAVEHRHVVAHDRDRARFEQGVLLELQRLRVQHGIERGVERRGDASGDGRAGLVRVVDLVGSGDGLPVGVPDVDVELLHRFVVAEHHRGLIETRSLGRLAPVRVEGRGHGAQRRLDILGDRGRRIACELETVFRHAGRDAVLVSGGHDDILADRSLEDHACRNGSRVEIRLQHAAFDIGVHEVLDALLGRVVVVLLVVLGRKKPPDVVFVTRRRKRELVGVGIVGDVERHARVLHVECRELLDDRDVGRDLALQVDAAGPYAVIRQRIERLVLVVGDALAGNGALHQLLDRGDLSCLDVAVGRLLNHGLEAVGEHLQVVGVLRLEFRLFHDVEVVVAGVAVGRRNDDPGRRRRDVRHVAGERKFGFGLRVPVKSLNLLIYTD